MKLSLLLLILAALSFAWVNASPVPGDEDGEEMERPPVGIVEQRGSKEEMKIDLEEISVEISSDGTEKMEDVETLMKQYFAKKAASDSRGDMTVEHFEIEADIDADENRDNAGDDRSRRHVFADDERLPVPDFPGRPYCAVGQLDNGCTAALIGPYHALTAAHCIYNVTSRQWRTNGLNFNQGKNCGRYGSKMFWVNARAVVGYTRHGLPEYNYALIIYSPHITSPCYLSLGYQTEWMGRGLDLIGYHSDKPRERFRCYSNRMYSSSCHFSSTAHNGLSLIYRADAMGADGGPLLSESTLQNNTLGSRTVYGINAYEDASGKWNFGPRITKDRFYQLVEWMSESGYNATIAN